MKNSLLFILLFAFISCENATPNPEDLQTVSFMPTACSEPWDNEKYAGGNRGSRIISYLKDNGIGDVYNFTSATDGMVYCQACSCPSGETFTFKVSKSDYTKLKTIVPFETYL
ncbi:MAG: hypothetical protein NWP83_02230 [Spirosomaceae bacterium]|nr:hypothetical protein [Spirosomataceae bacterium]